MFWTTEKKIIAFFAIVLLLLGVFAALSISQTHQVVEAIHSTSYSVAVSRSVNFLDEANIRLSDVARQYLADHSPDTLAEWERRRSEIEKEFQNLTAMVGEDAEQQKRLLEVRELMDHRFRAMGPDVDNSALEQAWKSGQPVGREIHEKFQQMDDAQRRILDLVVKGVEGRASLSNWTIGMGRLLAFIVVCASAFFILRDLRMRRKVEEELRRARIAAEMASEAKSTFLANMSHELRTPLTVMMGYTDLLTSRPNGAEDDGDRRERYLASLRKSGEHLLTIINDILDLSKIEAGRMEVESIECRLVVVLAEVESLMRPRAQGKGLSFAVDYATPVPERVITDPTRLRQILVNLVGNAIKFTEHGAVRIVVRYEVPPQDAEAASGTAADPTARPRLTIDVVDTGIGLSMEQRESLFEPFAQADVSTTRRFGGSGLGLSISRRLARMMGGDLTVTSEVNRGSTFRMSLPVTAVENAAMHSPGDIQHVLANNRPTVEPLRQVKARVLLAEDGPETRDVIELHLRRAGCDVATAPDGQVACEKALGARARGEAYDIILMDMQMPVMDGYTAVSKLRAEGYRGAIIALTAHAMKQDREQCLRAGCDEYAAKPIDVPALLRLMESLGAGAAASIKETLVADPILRELTQRFCDGTVGIIENLRGQLANGNLTALAAAAHQLAGAGGSYGFHDITREAKNLERQVKAGRPREAVEAQLERVAQTCAAAREWMKLSQGSPDATETPAK